MSTLTNICLAFIISLSALQPGYGGTPSPGRLLAQTPARRPLSASQVARKALPSVVYIEMEGAGNKPGCYGSGFFVINDSLTLTSMCSTAAGARPSSSLVADTLPLMRLNRMKHRHRVRLTAMDSMQAAANCKESLRVEKYAS